MTLSFRLWTSDLGLDFKLPEQTLALDDPVAYRAKRQRRICEPYVIETKQLVSFRR